MSPPGLKKHKVYNEDIIQEALALHARGSSWRKIEEQCCVPKSVLHRRVHGLGSSAKGGQTVSTKAQEEQLVHRDMLGMGQLS